MQRPASPCSRRATRVYSNTGRRPSEQAEDVAALEQAAEQLDDDALSRSRRETARGVRARSSATTRARSRRVARRRLAETAGERAAALWARINWARALQFQGDYAEAAQIDTSRESLALARESATAASRARRSAQLGILAFAARPLRRRAAATTEQALDVARAIGDRSLESGMINNLGEIEQLLGNYDAALELFQAGRRLCAEIGQRLADAYLLCNVAHERVPARRRGRLDRLGDGRRCGSPRS